MKKIKFQKAKPNIKTNGMSDLMEKVNVRKEGNLTTYTFKDQDELKQIRERMREIYTITAPLRVELRNLSVKHNELLNRMTGVKIG